MKSDNYFDVRHPVIIRDGCANFRTVACAVPLPIDQLGRIAHRAKFCVTDNAIFATDDEGNALRPATADEAKAYREAEWDLANYVKRIGIGFLRQRQIEYGESIRGRQGRMVKARALARRATNEVERTGYESEAAALAKEVAADKKKAQRNTLRLDLLHELQVSREPMRTAANTKAISMGYERASMESYRARSSLATCDLLR